MVSTANGKATRKPATRKGKKRKMTTEQLGRKATELTLKYEAAKMAETDSASPVKPAKNVKVPPAWLQEPNSLLALEHMTPLELHGKKEIARAAEEVTTSDRIVELIHWAVIGMQHQLDDLRDLRDGDLYNDVLPLTDKALLALVDLADAGTLIGEAITKLSDGFTEAQRGTIAEKMAEGRKGGVA